MSNNLTSNINLFQPTGFKVIIDRKNYANLEFFVQAVSHPGATNPSVETAYKRVAGVPMPGNQMQYGELTMDVLLDEDLNSYIEMYNWMLKLVNNEQVQQRDNFRGTRTDQPTYADIQVTALTSHNNKNKAFKYVDCIPVAIGDIRFEAQNQSVEYVTFPASFRFSYFDIV
jgi:hypothetical protein